MLPAGAEQSSAGRTLVALRQATGVSGTYALAIGDEFRTLSDEFGNGAQAGQTIRAKHPDDLGAALNAVHRRSPSPRAAEAAARSSARSSSCSCSASSSAALLLVSSRRRTRSDGRSTVGEISVDDDFDRLGDAIRALELDITLGDAGRADYDRALAAYDRANDLQRSGDEAGANHALDEGLAAIAAAREHIAGRR